MKILRVLITLLFVSILGISAAQAQDNACSGEVPEPPVGGGCAQNVNSLSPGQFQAIPFVDAQQNGNGNWPVYLDPDHNIISLYGAYGNNENASSNAQAAKNHYQKGIDLAANIKPRCHDGSVPTTTCQDGTVNPAIVFLFIGFSNADIEIGGGDKDAWDGQDMNQAHLQGQPCATKCPNLNNKNQIKFPHPWNQVTGDPTTQMSFLYQVYSPATPLVGPHVVVWNGAAGGQILSKWDPTSIGYYANNDCNFVSDKDDPECNYDRVKGELADGSGNGNTGGYTEAQVQAVFIKTSDSYPQCNLTRFYCSLIVLPDAYQSEIYLGDIVRYLKCCTLNPDGTSTGLPRYPNLQQVFITSRTYGGYANGQSGHNCLMAEPFAYEEGFAVQRLIVAQINQTGGVNATDNYSGAVDYGVTPWIDWGPYLWASGATQRNDGLNWCNGQGVGACSSTQFDVRYGDPGDQTDYFGDFTHPTAMGTQKVANLLVNFINGTTGSPWVKPWVGK